MQVTVVCAYFLVSSFILTCYVGYVFYFGIVEPVINQLPFFFAGMYNGFQGALVIASGIVQKAPKSQRPMGSPTKIKIVDSLSPA